MKKILIVSVGLFTVLAIFLGGLVALSPFFLNRYKDPLLAGISQSIHRKVTLGDLRLTLFTGIGLRLSDVSVANAEGFRPEPMMTLKSLQIRVKFFPLLRKRIEVDRVILREPRLLIEKNPEGVFNFSDLLQRTDEAGVGQTPRKAKEEEVAPLPSILSGFLVSRLILTGGTLTYVDAKARPAGREIRIHGLNLSVKDLSLSSPIPFTLSFGLSRDTEDVEMSGTIGPVGEGLKLSEIPMTVNLAVPNSPLSGIAKLLDGALPFTVRQGDLSLIWDISGDLAGGLRVAGRVRLSDLTLHDTETGKNPVRNLTGSLRQDVTFNLERERLDIKKADLTLGEGNLSVNGWISGLLKGPKLSLTLRSDPFPLSGWGRYLPALEGKDLAGSIQMDGRVSGEVSGKMKMVLRWTSPNFGEQGKMTTDLKIDLGPKRPAYQGEVRVTRVDLTKLQRLFDTGEKKTEGEFYAHLLLRGSGLKGDSVRKNLTGNGDFRIEKGALTNVNLEAEILSALSSRYGLSPTALARALGVSMAERDRTPFEEFKGLFRIGSGRARILDAVITSKNHGFSASGEVDWDRNLDLKARMILRKTGESRKKRFTYYLIDSKGRKVIPFRVTGNVSHPKVTVDLQALVRGQIGQTVEKKKEKLKLDLKKKLGPGAEELLKPLEKLFRFR